MTVNNNATGIIRANNTIGTAISGNTVNVAGNTGLIEATGTGGIAISANISATVANGSGSMSGASRGIGANTVNVTGNAGTIEATAAGGIAIDGTGVTVNNSSGTIRANGSDGVAIQGTTINVSNSGRIEATGTNGFAILTTTAATATATVNNLSGGVISGGAFGIFGQPAATLDVTNAAGATISGGPWYRRLRHSEERGHDHGRKQVGEFYRKRHQHADLANRLGVEWRCAHGSSTATNNLILQGSGTANNNFAGFTSLDVQANARWTLNGHSTVGAVTLQADASLAVGSTGHQDAVLTGDVTVNSRAALFGIGTIGGNINVMSGGGLAPGFADRHFKRDRQCRIHAGLELPCHCQCPRRPASLLSAEQPP